MSGTLQRRRLVSALAVALVALSIGGACGMAPYTPPSAPRSAPLGGGDFVEKAKAFVFLYRDRVARADLDGAIDLIAPDAPVLCDGSDDSVVGGTFRAYLSKHPQARVEAFSLSLVYSNVTSDGQAGKRVTFFGNYEQRLVLPTLEHARATGRIEFEVLIPQDGVLRIARVFAHPERGPEPVGVPGP